jgi:acyl-CoA synthetase (AMP-forming)/AMP-acid ligase II
VEDAGVIGVPDKKWGQRVVAFLKPSNREQPGEKLLKQHLRGAMRSFKIPKEYIFIDEIPKTPNGKIRRSELLEIYRKRQ